MSREGVPFSCPTCTRKARRRAALDAERTAAVRVTHARRRTASCCGIDITASVCVLILFTAHVLVMCWSCAR